jgi:hypothetical protein
VVSQADTNVFQADPTLVAGDIQRSINGGAFGNMDNLPTVTPALGKRIQIIVSAAETTAAADGGSIYIVASDQAGAEWQDRAVELRVNDADLASPEDVWSYTPRTLTESAASAADAITGAAITRTRCTTWSIDIEGVGNIAARTEFYFTIKKSTREDDDEALVKIEETIGLQVINGSTVGVVPGNGSIVVTDPVAGDFTVTVAAVETCKLTEEDNVHYDAKQILAASVPTPVTVGRFNIVSITTEAIT